MKKIGIILLAVVLNSFMAGAADVTCGGKSVIAQSQFTVTIHEGNKNSIAINDVETHVTAVLERPIVRAEEFVKCDPEDQACVYRDNKMSKNKLTDVSMMYLILFKSYQNYPVLKDVFGVDFDFSKVASVRVSVLHRKMFGLPGLYEYFDANGILLGRFLWQYGEFDPCK